MQRFVGTTFLLTGLLKLFLGCLLPLAPPDTWAYYRGIVGFHLGTYTRSVDSLDSRLGKR